VRLGDIDKLPIGPLAEACPAKLAAERQSRKSTKVLILF